MKFKIKVTRNNGVVSEHEAIAFICLDSTLCLVSNKKTDYKTDIQLSTIDKIEITPV